MVVWVLSNACESLCSCRSLRGREKRELKLRMRGRSSWQNWGLGLGRLPRRSSAPSLKLLHLSSIKQLLILKKPWDSSEFYVCARLCRVHLPCCNFSIRRCHVINCYLTWVFKFVMFVSLIVSYSILHFLLNLWCHLYFLFAWIGW